MTEDINEFISACLTCAQNKNSNRPPAGLLNPLTLSLDFVTSLPPSGGNTVILTVVDRFSKTVHFVPMPQFISKFWRCTLNGASVSLSSGYPPQSDGAAKSGTSERTEMLGRPDQAFDSKLESKSYLGQICSQLSPFHVQRVLPVLVCLWVPTAFIFCPGKSRSSICGCINS